MWQKKKRTQPAGGDEKTGCLIEIGIALGERGPIQDHELCRRPGKGSKGEEQRSQSNFTNRRGGRLESAGGKKVDGNDGKNQMLNATNLGGTKRSWNARTRTGERIILPVKH